MDTMAGIAAALAAEASALSSLVPAHAFPLTRALVAAELSRAVALTKFPPPPSPGCVPAGGSPSSTAVGSPVSTTAAVSAGSTASLSPFDSPTSSPSVTAFGPLPSLPPLTPQHGAPGSPTEGACVGSGGSEAATVGPVGLGGPPPPSAGCMDAAASVATPASSAAPALVRKRAKILIPVTSHPRVNFIGKLLGPRGSSLRSLERTTATRIMIRGRGSIRPEREPAVRGRPGWEHLSEALHIVIEAEGDEATASRALRKAREAVGLLLVPVDEERDELKKQQRRDLAILNGRVRGQLSEAALAAGLVAGDASGGPGGAPSSPAAGAGHAAYGVVDHPPPGRALAGSRPKAPIGWEAAAARAAGPRPTALAAVAIGGCVAPPSGGSSVTSADSDDDGEGGCAGARLPPSLDLDSLSLDEEAGAVAPSPVMGRDGWQVTSAAPASVAATPVGCVGGMVLPPPVGGVWSPPAVDGGFAAMFGVRPEAPPFTPGAGAGHPFRV